MVLSWDEVHPAHAPDGIAVHRRVIEPPAVSPVPGCPWLGEQQFAPLRRGFELLDPVSEVPRLCDRREIIARTIPVLFRGTQRNHEPDGETLSATGSSPMASAALRMIGCGRSARGCNDSVSPSASRRSGNGESHPSRRSERKTRSVGRARRLCTCHIFPAFGPPPLEKPREGQRSFAISSSASDRVRAWCANRTASSRRSASRRALNALRSRKRIFRSRPFRWEGISPRSSTL